MSQAFDNFSVEINAGVAHVQMCRPDEFNTMTKSWWRELPEVFNGLSDQSEVRAIVLSSQGKHFSAGMDLSVFAGGGVGEQPSKRDPARQAEVTRRSALQLQDCISSLENARQPVIAVIQGGCIGGAVDLITAADIRIGTANSFVVIQETNIGIVADVGTTQRLPTLIPLGLCRELVYTGERLYAERAEKAGLYNSVHESHEQALEAGMNMAKTIAQKSPLVVAGAKRVLNHARDHSVAEGLEYVAVWNGGQLSQNDLQDAMVAMVEKKDAEYADLSAGRKMWDAS